MGSFGMPGGCQTNEEADWGLVVLSRVCGPVRLNGSLAMLKGRTIMWSFWNVWESQTDVETNYRGHGAMSLSVVP